MRGLMIVLMMLCPGAALADEISGDWCGPDGRSLTILGPTVVTPGGTEVPGRYSRHRYEFETPAGEPGAGDTVVILQLSEEEVDVAFGSVAPVRWTRCRDVTS
ncbi:hypothetical protein CDO87_00900 [Sagittula sp. P11]|uniref:hypothetical protein n=1 Tax=Sagittula sp. P11 TaxID=2009329 RepID=UPI000C2CFB3C|nr:hypothetical protein [Sagittula sp. P11]AUC51838.1 hypothetical protein CDO87_00900 [Sagittula sp. P11]